MSWVKKNANFLISVLFTTVTMALFGPLEIYFTNATEFWFSLDVAAKIAAILAVCAFAVFLGIGLLLHGKARECYSYILFAITMLLYIQGNYANINYGLLDGAEIDWSSYWLYGLLDTLGWVLLLLALVVLWVKKRVWANWAQRYAALFVIAIQVITLGVLFATVDTANTEKSSYYLSTDGEFELSSGHNVIIFILDAFEETYLQQILEENGAYYRDVFSDFTHFSNATVGAARTKAAMPVIITGEAYEGGISYAEYIAESFDSDGLYTALKNENYDVRFYTKSAFIPDDLSTYVDNQVSTGYYVSSYTGIGMKCASLTLYKYCPHILKPLFWLNTADFDMYKRGTTAPAYEFSDVTFKEGVQKDLALNGTFENAFRLYHLSGAHPPYVLNEKAEDTGIKTDAIAQAKGALYIVEEYINQLKELDVYNDSTIIVAADHGEENPAYGLLLVKRRACDDKTFAESDAPVSYFDLHNTLFSEIGYPNGKTFFDIPTNESRVRYMNIYSSEKGTVICTEYVINGHAGDPEARSKTGRIFIEAFESKEYVYGTEMEFGINTSAAPFIVSGISGTDEGHYSWTHGHECEFAINLAALPTANLKVKFDLVSVYNELGPQRVLAYANDTLCAQATLSNEREFSFIIPKGVAEQNEPLSLRLEFPDAVCPAEVFGVGYDARTLALAIRTLTITETDDENEFFNWSQNVEAALKYDFAENSDFEYQLQGFHTMEHDHVWTSSQAEMLVKLPEICDYALKIRCGFYEPSGETQLFVNGEEIATLSSDNAQEDIVIRADMLNSDGIQRLSFSTPDAVAPSANGGSDRRVLGIALYGIEFVPTA